MANGKSIGVPQKHPVKTAKWGVALRNIKERPPRSAEIEAMLIERIRKRKLLEQERKQQ